MNNFISTVISNFKTYFKGRKISFFVGFSMAVLSVFVSLYYVIAYSANRDFNVGILLLTLFGGLAYMAIALFKKENVGALALGLCDFFAMLGFLRAYYPVVIDSDIMSGSFNITPEIANLIVITVFLLVISVTSNVLAWKKNSAEKQEETKNEA